MNVAPGYLLVCLLFWGWQTGLLWLSLGLGVILEVPRFNSTRWHLEQRDFSRITDLTTVAFAAIAVYQINAQSVHGIFALLRWFPCILFPLIVSQKFSLDGKVPLASLFFSLRRNPQSQLFSGIAAIDISYPYALVCVLSAATGNHRGLEFFLTLCVLAAWGLWSVRPKRYASYVWLPLFLLVGGGAFALQLGLQQAQSSMEAMFADWMDAFFSGQRDPDYATTAIGAIGRLKASDAIRLRVAAAAPLPHPFLLREAAYNTFQLGRWSATGGHFEAVDKLPGVDRWPLAQGEAGNTLRISMQLKKETGVVPVPQNGVFLGGKSIIEVQRNQYGSLMLEMPPGRIQYSVGFGVSANADGAPQEEDLILPQNYRELIHQVAADLHLSALSPLASMARIEAFFEANFHYSLVQKRRYYFKPLKEFLLHSRAGHCEYFATATVLLLRAAGIPARYAVGYSLQEYSPLERQYIARARHAHAWALAYVDGAWRAVDTTPSVWASLEDDAASSWRIVLDLWSWGRFHAEELLAGAAASRYTVATVVLTLIAYLLWRMRTRQRLRQEIVTMDVPAVAAPGLDSEIYRVVARIELLGYHMKPGETLYAWIGRLESIEHASLAPLVDLLRSLLTIHYRYRFDPAGIDADERRHLAEAVAARERDPW